MKSDTTIVSYTGGRPLGQPAPDLLGVPISNDTNFSFVFALAFARDTNRDGIFQPFWDPNITPDLIAQVKQQRPQASFVASLAGDNFPWQGPADETAWVNNAVTSLIGLKNTYHLSGFDLDYENGLDESFFRVISRLMQALNDVPNFPPRFTTNFSMAPFGQTSDYYQRLFAENSTYVANYNYQVYADGLEGQGVQGNLNKYAQLASANPNQVFNGYQGIGLGICSNTQMPRGLQAPDILTVWDSLHSQGVRTVAIWSLEDSAKNGYYLENQIQSRS